jgi:hypothetical protein
LQTGDEQASFSNKKFLIVMAALLVTLLIDTSIVKINDLVDKIFIPIQDKLILFSVNSSLCLLFQFFIIKYVKSSFKGGRLDKTQTKVFYVISLTSLCVVAALMCVLMFQQFYNNYYDTSIIISIIATSYGIAAALIIWLSLLFLSWYKSNHSFIVFLYFVSMLIIAFNLIMTAAFTGAKVSDRPSHAGEYIGSSGDVSAGKYVALDTIYRISSFMSFFSIWITTALLMGHYREKLVNDIIYWVILSLPFVYFIITYSYQVILAKLLIAYLAVDPITVSIALGAFLSLSKPIGGLIFAFAFWKIARTISYEKNIRTYMIISGWGILLIFGANQAATQIVSPFPPFGLATITVLIMAGFLMLLGIYNSALLVSANQELRKSIFKHAFESRLLRLIGQAEMEGEIEKTVKKIAKDKNILDIDSEQQRLMEIDEIGLKKYLDFVIKEVKKDDGNEH